MATGACCEPLLWTLEVSNFVDFPAPCVSLPRCCPAFVLCRGGSDYLSSDSALVETGREVLSRILLRDDDTSVSGGRALSVMEPSGLGAGSSSAGRGDVFSTPSYR